MARTIVVISNLRAFTIVLVVSFHSVLAYLASQPASQPAFEAPPYTWRAFPILDHEKSLGFDLYCALLYVFLMPFMFLISGLFVWGSLRRKGVRVFLYDRLLRIGVPFILGTALLMPVTHYPVYLVMAKDPSWSAFWMHWTALPFWAAGPLWFLWHLLVLDFAAAAIFRFAPGFGERLARISASAGESPGRYFVGLSIASALAYLPLATFFKPWDWAQFGPFSLQCGQVLLFIVYFFAGVGIGANGLDCGLLQSDGRLAQRWASWLGLAVVVFVSWLAVMALIEKGGTQLLVLQQLANLLFALSVLLCTLALIAIFMRFANRNISLANSLSKNAYGIYLVHYLFVVWLQFLLLGTAISAVGKGAIVFAGALVFSWRTAIALRQTPVLGRLIFAERRASRAASRVQTPADITAGDRSHSAKALRL